MDCQRGTVDLVAGGPPCQGFSFAGKRLEDDPRNRLFAWHLEIVELLQPKLVLMENVRGIDVAFNKASGKQKSSHTISYAKKIADVLKSHGYVVQQDVLRAYEYGIPQLRPRYFTLGIRKDLLRDYQIENTDTKSDESFDGEKQVPCLFSTVAEHRDEFFQARKLPANGRVSVKDAISDLVTTGKTLVDCTDPLSPKGFKEIRYVKPETPYQELMHKHMRADAMNSLRLVNHRPQTVERYQQILKNCRKGVQMSPDDRSRFGIRKSVLVPLDGEKPSHTLTTIPDDLLHYEEPRIHTVREHARLQSFPDWFEFRGRFTTGGVRRSQECPRYTQVGNAVPPLLAEIIGEALLAILDQVTAQQQPNIKSK